MGRGNFACLIRQVAAFWPCLAGFPAEPVALFRLPALLALAYGAD